MFGVLGDAASALVDAVLPRPCGGCRRPGVRWCARCDAAVRAATALGAVAAPPGLRPLPVHVAGGYDGPLRNALLAYKERGRRDLAPILGAALAHAVRRARAAARSVDRLALVAVPASRAGWHERGFDHVTELLTAAPALPAPERLLRWRRRVADQAGLDRAERAANLAFALDTRAAVARRWHPNVAVLLVDDVVTTGATLGEAVRACERRGIAVAGAAALLATRAVPAASARGAGRPLGGDVVGRAERTNRARLTPSRGRYDYARWS